ncbi:MAG: AAC(3) family N-acetyltransferase [Candidatus Binatia bacterium]
MTREELARLLEGLSLRGNHIVVHASLPSFGDGDGRPVCVALVEAVGESGTVVMPAFTYAETLSGPPTGVTATGGARRPVAFHQDLPVSREVGAVAEAFRHLPGVLRSSHPTHSFAAWGRQAREVLSTQRDNNPLGPLKKLNVMQGHVLLLGTTLQAATAIHLAEERLGLPYRNRRTAVRVNAAGYDERVVLENVPGCSEGFIRIEDHLDPAKVRSVPLPRGVARKIPIRHLVNLATKLLETDPQLFICDDPACPSCAGKRELFAGRGTLQHAGLSPQD